MFRPSIFVIAFCSGSAVAASTITIDNTFGFRDYRSQNSIGLATGDRILYGVSGVAPVGEPPDYIGTEAISRQGDLEYPLFFAPSTVDPGEFVNGLPYDQSLTGPWEITITSPGLEPLVVSTPDIGDVARVEPVTALKMSGSRSAPTFTWTNPAGIDDVSIGVWDTTARGPIGVADRLFQVFPGSAVESFTLPEGLLQDDRLYTFAVEARIKYATETPFASPVSSRV